MKKTEPTAVSVFSWCVMNAPFLGSIKAQFERRFTSQSFFPFFLWRLFYEKIVAITVISNTKNVSLYSNTTRTSVLKKISNLGNLLFSSINFEKFVFISPSLTVASNAKITSLETIKKQVVIFDCFFFPLTSLKIPALPAGRLDVALAMPAFFALSKKKISYSKLNNLFFYRSLNSPFRTKNDHWSISSNGIGAGELPIRAVCTNVERKMILFLNIKKSKEEISKLGLPFFG